MPIRRTVATLISIAALGSGVGALTGCSDPGNSRTGTPADTATDTSATVPSDASFGPTPSQSSGG
jgi:hypothetical protein